MLEQLADVYAPIAADLRRVDRMLRDELRADLPCVDELCAHVERFRGKMLRPAVLMMCGQAAGRVGPEHHTLAAVVEMVHLATLVHDDVLDDADLRRNLPAVNRRWGTESAVLLGDYLFSHAFHLCSSLESQFASQRIGATARRLCEGELLQIAHRGRFDLDEATYFEIIARKTASLTETSAVLGARYAGADDAAVDQLARYGRSLGMAFQIADDLLDLTGETRELGKPVGRDVDQGEVTLPVIRHLQTASPAQRAAMLAALAGCDAPHVAGAAHTNGSAARPPSAAASGDADHESDSAANDHGDAARRGVRALLRESDLDYARDAARAHIAAAVESLADLPVTDARDALAAMAEFVLLRRR
jgi:octaprenyl-diphosphate synthase